jgi:hypothetical protein
MCKPKKQGAERCFIHAMDDDHIVLKEKHQKAQSEGYTRRPNGCSSRSRPRRRAWRSLNGPGSWTWLMSGAVAVT